MSQPRFFFTTDFTQNPVSFMHVDINSCFAAIEQQANPFLRGKPVAVAAYTTNSGCILAASIEAKRFGIKTGMRVFEGKQLCPYLYILPGDPSKYRFINQKLTKLLETYSPNLSIRSIDEMVLNFQNLPILKQKTMQEIALEIKSRMREEIGEWITVSIGISTNPYLAKLAAGLKKPDGLVEIDQQNILSILSALKLTDLHYIKENNQLRLNRVDIFTPLDFYNASYQKLKLAFASINAYYWYARLHGFLIDEIEWGRKSIGHSFSLPRPTNNLFELKQILCRLVEKIGRRLRKNNLTASGIFLSCGFVDGSGWHKSKTQEHAMFTTQELFTAICELLEMVKPLPPVRHLAVSSFGFTQGLYQQLDFLAAGQKNQALTQAMDRLNDRWGEFTVASALTLNMNQKVVDRIAFGKVHDMQQVV